MKYFLALAFTMLGFTVGFSAGYTRGGAEAQAESSDYPLYLITSQGFDSFNATIQCYENFAYTRSKYKDSFDFDAAAIGFAKQKHGDSVYVYEVRKIYAP